jgi:hypothetical protein
MRVLALLTGKGRAPTQRALKGERVAQTVEHVTFNHGVLGSIPSALTKRNQSLSAKIGSNGFPENCRWEAAGKGERSLRLRRAQKACGKRGADVRPDFNWNKTQVAMMGYRRFNA